MSISAHQNDLPADYPQNAATAKRFLEAIKPRDPKYNADSYLPAWGGWAVSYQQQQLDKLIQIGRDSRNFREISNALGRAGMTVRYSPQKNDSVGGYFMVATMQDMVSKNKYDTETYISITQSAFPEFSLSAMAHEFRHGWQYLQGYSFGVELSPREYLTFMRHIEADAHACQARMVFEMAMARNQPQLVRSIISLRMSGVSDLLKKFTDVYSTATDIFEKQERLDYATRHVYQAFLNDKQRITQYDENHLNQYKKMMKRRHPNNWATHQLPDNYVVGLSTGPDGRGYWSQSTVNALVMPGFAAQIENELFDLETQIEFTQNNLDITAKKPVAQITAPLSEPMRNARRALQPQQESLLGSLKRIIFG